jgi:type IV secretion system protein VirB9
MSPRRLLLSGVALLALGSVANASEVPAPCGPDPRERCVNYRPGQIVRVYLAPGATVTIELPAAESIFFVGVSDDGVIRGTGSSDRVASGSDATADPNLMTAVPVGGDKDHKFTQFLTLKALHHLEPQPLLVLANTIDPVTRETVARRHVFEVLTRPGDLGEQVPDTFFSVRFRDPRAEAEVRAAKLKAAAAEQEARIAPERLQTVSLNATHRNMRYDGWATEADRAALAPSEMWDDGQRTYLRYPGNRRIPVAWQVMADGKEGVVGQSTDTDPTTSGVLLVVQGVVPMLRLRDGGAVLCIVNRAYDPTGRNPGTGTVDPGVQRLNREGTHG